jgi:Sulfatase
MTDRFHRDRRRATEGWLRAAAAIALVFTSSCRPPSAPPPPTLSLARLDASAAGTQELSGVFRECLISRAPEALRFQVRLPSHPWLDLNLGTMDDGPVTFRVSATIGATSQFGEPSSVLLLERTLTRGRRWEPAAVDLSAFASRRVTLTLALASNAPAREAGAAPPAGAIGFWGSPVVRDRSRPMPGFRPAGVIVVRSIALRRELLGAYGASRSGSPHIDRIASEGAAFDARPEGRSAPIPAEPFRDAGYATVAYSSAPAASPRPGPEAGFEELHARASLPDDDAGDSAREFVDRLLPWLTAHKDGPFFVSLELDDGSIRRLDDEIGRLVERLQAEGLSERTLIVLAGERADEPAGAPRLVPLILRGPGVAQRGVRVAGPVDAIDVVPTVLAMCGLPVPASVGGRNLQPGLRH